MKNSISSVLLLLFLALSNNCFADADPPETDVIPKDSSLFERWFDSFVDIHDRTSHHYMSMVHSIDAYFSGEKIEEASNGSYVKLELNNTFYKNGVQDDGISIDAKVELPNTEKNLKLFFSSDPEEEKSLEQKIKNNATGQRIQKESSVAGIEYNPEKTESNWNHSFSTGVKIRVSPVPFMRYKFGNEWQLNPNWTSQFKQSFWNYQDEGLGATTKLNFSMPLSEVRTFKAETEAEYRDKDNKYYYAQTFSDIHRISDISAIRYWIAVLGESQPTSEVSSYLVGTQYRRSLYRDWILFSVSPILAFPREEHWEATPSLTLDLQVYFTE